LNHNDRRIHELETRVAELTALLQERVTEPLAHPALEANSHETAEPARSSRRGMLKLAGAAAVGAAAAAATSALPAAANNTDPMTLGNAGGGGAIAGTTHQALSQTRFDWLGIAGGVGFLFQAGAEFTNSDAAFKAALAGWTTLTNTPNGVYGFTDKAGYGVIGSGGGSASIGVLARGTKANAHLSPVGTAPAARTDAHSVGELIEDSSGALWVCIGAGTPGTWRKIAGPSTAGAFHALTPGRVYDSRAATPSPGTLSSGANRTVSVANSRNADGSVAVTDFVPAGAVAVTANVTVTNTVNAGFLTVNPGGITTTLSSTINWFGNNQNLANGITLTLNANRELTVVAGGGGICDFIIDITGYYL
jgi:hypothetical protein